MYSVGSIVFIFMFVPCINGIKAFFFFFLTDEHHYKIIGLLKQATPSSTVYSSLAQQAGMPP
jgi:hypothetical protein